VSSARTRRAASSICTDRVASRSSFFLIHLVPGDPARTISGIRRECARRLVRHQFGLDRPLWLQYEKFMGRCHGDLGKSLVLRRLAGHLVLQRLPVTLWLIGFGALLAVLWPCLWRPSPRPGATGSPTMSCGRSLIGSAFRRSGWHRAAARVRPQPRRLFRSAVRKRLRGICTHVLPALTSLRIARS